MKRFVSLILSVCFLFSINTIDTILIQKKNL